MIKNHSQRLQLLCTVLSVIGCLVCGDVQAASASEPMGAPILLALGDVGPIKNDLAPTDPSANRLWAELNEQQRTVLTPLADQWDGLRAWQREKMLDIANEYPKMDTQKQQRIQQRLVKWSRMTPFERENARKRYQQFQSLSPEKKELLRKQWKAHQRKAMSEGYDPDFDNASQ